MLLNITVAALEQVEEFNESIQATTINFKIIINRVEILKKSLRSLRSDKEFSLLLKKTSGEAVKYELDEPIVQRNRKAPKRLDSNNHSAYFPPTPEVRLEQFSSVSLIRP